LNLSELDGWWAEAYTPEVGWAVGDDEEHAEHGRDVDEAAQLYRLLEDDIVPLFYDRDGKGIPRGWVKRIRASMATLAPQFSTNRMAREYVEQLYLPAAASLNKRRAQGGQLARELRQWEVTLRHVWHETHLGQLVVRKQPGGWVFDVQVYLGAVSPETVQVQLYADARNTFASMCLDMHRHVEIPGVVNGYIYKCKVNSTRPYRDFTPRLVPYHPEANLPAENPLITWWSGQQKLYE
jgi:starch phosphorylase